MQHLLQRLRDTPCNREPFTDAHAECQCRIANAAADHIELLERLLARYRDETPLGHQPHMIAYEADAALGRKER